MSSKRKFNRKSKYTLSQKIISAVTTAGFIMQPFTAFAGQIIKQNDLNNNLISIFTAYLIIYQVFQIPCHIHHCHN